MAKSKLCAFLILSFFSSFFAQTLSRTDLAIIGLNTYGEDFTFVCFTDLSEGTVIYFTDDEPTANGSKIIDISEGIVKYTVPAPGVTAGNVISYKNDSSNFVVENSGFTLANSGDNLIAFQGYNSSTHEVTTFLHCVYNTGTMTYSLSGLTSADSLHMTSDDGEYTGTRTGTSNSLYGHFAEADDWTFYGDFTGSLNTTGFTILESASTIEEPSTGDLIISEMNSTQSAYATYVELYNGTSKTVLLDEVYLDFYSNGSASIDATSTLSGTVESGGYIIVARRASDFNTVYSQNADFENSGFVLNGGTDGLALRTTNNGIIDKFNDVPSATGSWTDNHLFERVNYPNDGTNLSSHWSDVGANKDGTPNAANSQEVPVELVSFSAELVNYGVRLEWNTATEVDNYGFDVERKNSADRNGIWKKVIFVEGHGNSNSPQNYSFTDKIESNSEIGKTVQYRLKQIDFNGTFEYSQAVQVEIKFPAVLKLNQNYPNPFNPETKINFNLPAAGKVRLAVYNLLGEEISKLLDEELNPGLHTVSFNSGGLASGIYYYSIQFGSEILVRKMIVLK